MNYFCMEWPLAGALVGVLLIWGLQRMLPPE